MSSTPFQSTSWQVGTYRVYVYAGRPSNGFIRLEEEGGNRAIHAYFMNQNPLPANSLSASFYFLYFSFDQFAPIMEMLREEKPIFVHAFNANNVHIGTHQEPIGEAE